MDCKAQGRVNYFLLDLKILFLVGVIDFENTGKGSITYYVITKGQGGFGMISVIFALSNAEFDYGRDLETDKK